MPVRDYPGRLELKDIPPEKFSCYLKHSPHGEDSNPDTQAQEVRCILIVGGGIVEVSCGRFIAMKQSGQGQIGTQIEQNISGQA